MMTLLHDATQAKKFDTRVVERNINRGFAKPEEHDKSTKELPDDSDNALWTNLDELAQDPSVK